MLLNILMAVALLTVLGTLVLGMINLVKPGEEAQLKSNKLMRWRVIAQACAIGIFMLVVAVKKQNGG
ncbi:MAG TPA: twin transmembrane helix small protein [Hellea balneolensis]|uniref:Twin transmembrane helix small protein n=1 Tax=Hellea balneolensis TaxID=287478 RepID=A0A7C3GL39_9PROT|nr:twin transmembrane helix small protein [Hellea balneolensis]